ncbi:unnamed protein product [Paramecium pentaurelia]|uniref:Band 7 domain-containing protein n=1 Tax=Paramecium pentaurelia TaxID=43138 RepID=A0A8S1YAT5_9CILI|nr:unnamed protein product [Paramecium pentaurelia]
MKNLRSCLQSEQAYKEIREYKENIEDDNTLRYVLETVEEIIDGFRNETDQLIKELMDLHYECVLDGVTKNLIFMIEEIIKRDSKKRERGKYYFSENPDQKLMILGNTLVRLSLESIFVWNLWHPHNAVINQIYLRLKESGVEFPKLHYFNAQKVKEYYMVVKESSKNGSLYRQQSSMLNEQCFDQLKKVIEKSQFNNGKLHEINEELKQIKIVNENQKVFIENFDKAYQDYLVNKQLEQFNNQIHSMQMCKLSQVVQNMMNSKVIKIKIINYAVILQINKVIISQELLVIKILNIKIINLLKNYFKKMIQYKLKFRVLKYQKLLLKIKININDESMSFEKEMEIKKKRESRRERSKFEDIQEENESQKMTCYESILNCMGSCFGTLRAWIPCCFCCCPYPYYLVTQGQKGLLQKFGKYVKTLDSGLHEINPFTERVIPVSTKTFIIDLERQLVLTKDNITVNIDTIVYYRVVDVMKSAYRVKMIVEAIKEITYATLRTICGEHTLQEIIENRQKIADEIEGFIFDVVSEWGIYLEHIFIKDMLMNEELQSSLSNAPKAQRLAQSKIISAQSDVSAAKLLREAADMLDSRAAMQIRYFETVQLIAKNHNPKILFLSMDQQNQKK